MILYFSGTGNSRYVAELLANNLNDIAINICELKPDEFILSYNQTNTTSIGFVFPVYSWGVPPIMADFIESLPQDAIETILVNDVPIWMTATCGDETGNAHKMFCKLIQNKGLSLRGAWSVIMPNTYVLLPGFDIDSEEIRKNKIKEAPKKIKTISDKIKHDKWEVNPFTGSMSAVKTALVYPLFRKWGISPSKWEATDKCIGCKQCEQACPVNNISFENGRPCWGNNCTSCLACYHVCPIHAIEYGKATLRKGQYRPDERPEHNITYLKNCVISSKKPE